MEWQIQGGQTKQNYKYINIKDIDIDSTIATATATARDQKPGIYVNSVVK